MYEKKDVSPVKATNSLVFGQCLIYNIIYQSLGKSTWSLKPAPARRRQRRARSTREKSEDQGYFSQLSRKTLDFNDKIILNWSNPPPPQTPFNIPMYIYKNSHWKANFAENKQQGHWWTMSMAPS